MTLHSITFYLLEMLGLSLNLSTLSRAVKPKISGPSVMRYSCRVKAMLATSCLMYSSHSSVRFTEVILRLAMLDSSMLLWLLETC